jgi:hypothetical protein
MSWSCMQRIVYEPPLMISLGDKHRAVGPHKPAPRRADAAADRLFKDGVEVDCLDGAEAVGRHAEQNQLLAGPGLPQPLLPGSVWCFRLVSRAWRATSVHAGLERASRCKPDNSAPFWSKHHHPPTASALRSRWSPRPASRRRW